MVKFEPEQQQQQQQQNDANPLFAQRHNMEAAKEGDGANVASLEAALAARDKEIAEKDAEIARLQSEVQRLQRDSVTPQQMLQQLDLLRSSINDSVDAAAQHQRHYASTPVDTASSTPLLPSQQAQVHYKEGCLKSESVCPALRARAQPSRAGMTAEPLSKQVSNGRKRRC